MSNNSGITVVLVAAGRSERFGGKPKLLVQVGAYPVLFYLLTSIFSLQDLERVVVVASQPVARWLESNMPNPPVELKIVGGGHNRSMSVWLGLQEVETEFVLVHDAARCVVPTYLFSQVVDQIGLDTGCIPILPITDTIVLVDDKETVCGLTDRANFRMVQTPQGFRTMQLKETFLKTGIDTEFTDESTRFHSAGLKVVTIPGDKDNIKLTWPSDIWLVAAIIQQQHPILFEDLV